MAVVFNGFPDNTYDVIFHVETDLGCGPGKIEAGTLCYAGLEDRLDLRSFDGYATSGVAAKPAEVAFVVEPTDSIEEFAEMISRLEPAVTRGGVCNENVLVILDCWGKSGPDCFGSDTAEGIDWTPLSTRPFDFSVWDHQRCPEDIRAQSRSWPDATRRP